MRVPDFGQFSYTLVVVVVGLGVSLAAGVSVVIALNPTTIAAYVHPTTVAVPPLLATPTVRATPQVAPPLPGLAQQAPTVAPPTQSEPGSALVLEPAPFSTPTAAIVPTDAPPVQSAWNAAQPQLDALWGNDAAGTLALLTEFHTRFPDFEPATTKLYVAMLTRAADLAEQGATDDAANQLGQAVELLPERPEAPAALANLSADTAQAAGNPEAPLSPEQDAQGAAELRLADDTTHAPAAPAPATSAPVRAPPAPAPVRAAPAPQVVQVNPTPTKVPFVPRGTP